MLPNRLKLYIADVVDDDTECQELWYIVGETYDLSFERFIEEANKTWHEYSYYFYEADDEAIENFMEYYKDESIKVGVYSL